MIELATFVLITVAAVVFMIAHKWSFGGRAALSAADDSSAILSYYTAGHGLVNGSRAKLGSMRYSIFVTLPGDGQSGLSYVNESALIYALDLPFNTQTHLVGLSKVYKLDRLQFATYLRSIGLESVRLEGDFPDYFDIYATRNMGLQVQYILDPDTMAFVIDYCRSHFWEIRDAQLYFVVTEHDKQSDNILVDSQKFVDSIRPALLPGSPSAPPVHHDVPYGEYDGPALPCPICSQTMALADAWQSCINGHGVFINGRDIIRLHSGELSISADPSKTTEHGQLTCPNCHNQMSLVNYEDSAVQIDSCTHCPFRWLDASEVMVLMPRSLAKQI